MDTISAENTYVEPKVRAVRLPAALAVGAVAVAGAFGGGYTVANVLDRPVRATVTASSAAAGHTWSDAVGESLVLERRSAVRGKAADIRYERVR